MKNTKVPVPVTETPETPDMADMAELRRVLDAAYAQAATGKGRQRHNPRSLPFTAQKIMTLGRMTGVGGPVFQSCKKATEAQTMAERGLHQSARAELLGAIVYLAAAYLLCEEDACE